MAGRSTIITQDSLNNLTAAQLAQLQLMTQLAARAAPRHLSLSLGAPEGTQSASQPMPTQGLGHSAPAVHSESLSSMPVSISRAPFIPAAQQDESK